MDLEAIKSQLIEKDKKLERLFREVDEKIDNIFESQKTPFPALIGAIIGQKISYYSARKMRGDLYSRVGTEFGPEEVLVLDLSFLGQKEDTVRKVSLHIIDNDITLSSEEDIYSLECVLGVGKWTTQTTILTSMIHLDSGYDIFPLGDKFIQKRMTKLYGNSVDMKR